MSRFTLLALTGSIVIVVSAQIFADDDNCAAMMCLSAPGNVWKKIEQCLIPVNHVLRKISFGEDVRCKQQNADGTTSGSGLTLTTGTQPYIDCATSYGPGWRDDRRSDEGGDSPDLTCTPGKIGGCKSPGSGIGSGGVAAMCINPTTGATQPKQPNPEPNYVSVYANGVLQGTSYYTNSDVSTSP